MCAHVQNVWTHPCLYTSSSDFLYCSRHMNNPSQGHRLTTNVNMSHNKLLSQTTSVVVFWWGLAVWETKFTRGAPCSVKYLSKTDEKSHTGGGFPIKDKDRNIQLISVFGCWSLESCSDTFWREKAFWWISSLQVLFHQLVSFELCFTAHFPCRLNLLSCEDTRKIRAEVKKNN